MIKLRAKSFLRKVLSYWFIWLPLCTGLAFRIAEFGQYILSFDQVQILSQAEKILSGSFTLIGPKTGPAPMFTGPLIYYLTAILMLLIPVPYTGVVVSLLLATATSLCLSFLTYIYTRSKKTTFIATSIWALSPWLINADRIFWNPNLSLLSSILVFLPLFKLVNNKKLNKPDLILVSVGTFFGYQAHFGGLLLFVLPSVISLIIIRKINQSLFASSLIGFAISLFPTLLFDLRHDWLNTKGLLSILAVSSGDMVSLLKHIGNSLQISLENFARIILFNLTELNLSLIGLGVLTISLLYFWKKKQVHSRAQLVLSLTWIGAVAVLFGFYSGNKPEYYYLMQIPALIYLWSLLISSLDYKIITVLVFSFFGIVLFRFDTYAHLSNYQLANQWRLTQDIVAFSQQHPIEKVEYNYHPINREGLEYLINRQIKFQEPGNRVHIGFLSDGGKRYGHLGIKVEPPVSVDRQLITSGNFQFLVPREPHLNIEHVEALSSADLFSVYINGLGPRRLWVSQVNPFDDKLFSDIALVKLESYTQEEKSKKIQQDIVFMTLEKEAYWLIIEVYPTDPIDWIFKVQIYSNLYLDHLP